MRKERSSGKGEGARTLALQALDAGHGQRVLCPVRAGCARPRAVAAHGRRGRERAGGKKHTSRVMYHSCSVLILSARGKNRGGIKLCSVWSSAEKAPQRAEAQGGHSLGCNGVDWARHALLRRLIAAQQRDQRQTGKGRHHRLQCTARDQRHARDWGHWRHGSR